MGPTSIGLTGYSERVTEELSIAPGAVGEAILSCKSGRQAVSGGWTFDGEPADGDRLLGNGPGVLTADGTFAPPADGQLANAWRVQALNGAGVTRPFDLYVNCLVAETATVP